MAKIKISNKRKCDVSASLYGIFYEDINRSAERLYPELLRNRAFEDSIVPKGAMASEEGTMITTRTGFKTCFHHGEGNYQWIIDNHTETTPIPAWYSKNAKMSLCVTDTLNKNREAALDVQFMANGKIENEGHAGISVKEGEKYHLTFFAKTLQEASVVLGFSIESNGVSQSNIETVMIRQTEYTQFDIEFTTWNTISDGKLVITANHVGRIRFGFMMLKPVNTYLGHGFEPELIETLKEIHPKFMRFPGGCDVEGMTFETALRFSEMIGPTWERPSKFVMWHYRSLNDLGYHEMLQLCEDLNMDALYVVNCGMTCQSRKPYYFNDKETDEMIEECLNAISYAVDPVSTYYGAMRAANGHEAPFAMKYIEVGNENRGPEYYVRYKKFYDAIKAKYPQIQVVANEHVENQGLKADVVDDHMFNAAEYFITNDDFFESYDRSDPAIFFGEFSVTVGKTASLYAALAEAAFITGIERNQDVVKLISYAPLFKDTRYSAWEPDMICYDGLRHYTIPSFYIWKLFSAHRGECVLEAELKTPEVNQPFQGTFGIWGTEGVKFCNSKKNHVPCKPYQSVLGSYEFEQDKQTYVMKTGPVVGMFDLFAQRFEGKSLVLLGEDTCDTEGVYEIECVGGSKDEIGMALFCSPGNPTMHWTVYDQKPEKYSLTTVLPMKWIIKENHLKVMYGRAGREIQIGEADVKHLFVREKSEEGIFNKFKTIVREGMIYIVVNEVEVLKVPFPKMKALHMVVTESKEEVIIKAVNVADREEPLNITLDSDTKKDYIVRYIMGDYDDQNTFGEPEKIHILEKEMTKEGNGFCYRCPPLSASVIILQKGK